MKKRQPSNSNWNAVKSSITAVPSSIKPNNTGESASVTNKRKRNDLNSAVNALKTPIEQTPKSISPKDYIPKDIKANYVGLDCEMVGIGSDGKESALARCCLVDFEGQAIYDKFVRPPSFVTDFRTKWSGVRKSDLRDAISLEQCRDEVCRLLRGKVLVGHALKNDLTVLLISHPRKHIRDTACYKPYMRPHGRGGKMRPRALRELSKQYLGIEIQTGEHDPSEDARTAMLLYRLRRKEWETDLREFRGKGKRKEESVEIGDEGDEEGDEIETPDIPASAKPKKADKQVPSMFGQISSTRTIQSVDKEMIQRKKGKRT